MPHSVDNFVCLRCGAYSAHLWSDLRAAVRGSQGNHSHMDFSDVEETFVLLSGGELRANQPPVDKWRAATCSACLGSSVWRGGVSVYPPSSTLPDPHADMPSDAAVLYREAKDVLPHSRRAGAALARASLERLVKTLDPEAGLIPLDRRIARLETRVSSSLWELLTVLRHVGNKAVHVEEQSDELVAFYLDEEDGTELAEAMFDAINELVDELVTKPGRVRSYFDRLPAGVRESALGKLGKKD